MVSIRASECMALKRLNLDSLVQLEKHPLLMLLGDRKIMAVVDSSFPAKVYTYNQHNLQQNSTEIAGYRAEVTDYSPFCK